MIKDYTLDDLRENADGDLVISNGDLVLTDKNRLENLEQYIRTILSTPLDNPFFPNMGVDMDEFVGMANTEQTANFIHDTLLAAITRDGYITRDSVNIEIFPINKNEIQIAIIAKSIVDNKLKEIRIMTVFDYMTGRMLTLRG